MPKVFLSLINFIKPGLIIRLWGNIEVDDSITKKALAYSPYYSSKDGIKHTIMGK